MKFTTKELDAIRKDITTALSDVEKKHGINITTGKINYSDYDFTMSLKAVKNDGDTNGEQKIFEKYCRMYGFEPDQYKAEFTLDGRVFQLVGFNLNSPKNCCSILSVKDGKTFKTNNETVKRALRDKAS